MMETVIKKHKTLKYPAYKDSGTEWLGKIPTHWEIKKIKRIFFEKKYSNNIELNCGSISFGKVVLKDDERIPHSTKKSYQVVSKGDFLINPLNLNYDLISLRIALSDLDVVVSSGYIVLKNSISLDKSYFKWLLHRFDVAYMKVLGSGVRQTLNYSDIGNCDLIFPPIPEQSAIADFLESKTELIDKAISIKEKQIELLKERKQLLIHKAITRGVKRDVKLKQSGVDWIGEIPENWEIKKLKHIAQVVLGKMLCNEDKGNYHLKPYLKSKNIQWLNVDVSSVDLMWFSKKEMIEYRLKKGDLILSEGGEVGKTCIWNNELDECYIQNSAHKVSFHEGNVQEYFLYQFFTAGKIGLFEKIVNRVSIGHLTKDKLINIDVIRPPKEEQIAISEWIDTLTRKINTAISLKEKEIEKLKEHKMSLIDEVVTGKIKVYQHGKPN